MASLLRPALAFASLLVLTVPLVAADPPTLPLPRNPHAVLDDLRTFLERAARPDGSFRPGLEPDYEGMSDSAYSDLAPTAYAVVIHKTFGWALPDEEKTRQFLLCRQAPDGAFFNMSGTVDPKSAAGR